MGPSKDRTRSAKAALLALATSLLTLLFSATALADPPAHSRKATLDLTGLNKACGAAVDSKGDLYASSAGEDEIRVYDPSHAELTTIENTNEPCGLAVDSKGNLYVSEQATGNVVRYKPNAFPFSGTPTYEGPTAIDSSGAAKGIAVDRTDDRLYVAKGTKVAIYKSDGSFEANVGEGNLTEATGVSAYTYIFGTSPNLNRHYYLSVTDAAPDEIKVFSAKEGTALKLRKTISGVDHDEDPETPDQAFGFGTEGAALAADPGNESRETRKCVQVAEQACTQGHFFLYDAANEAVDEFDATGEFVDQIANGAFEDAEPSALAVERSGTASDGTLYVGAGAVAGAKLLAFGPLGMPSRKALPALSRALTKARAVAVDCEGYVYVGAEAAIRVYSPSGVEVTSMVDAEQPRDLAADCEGNVYVVDQGEVEPSFTYYAPSSYPPSPTTTYSREPELIPGGEFEGAGLQAVAVNPADEHAFVMGNSFFAPIIVEFGAAEESSPVIGKCGEGLGLVGTRLDIDVYGATGEVYVTGGNQNLATVRCGSEPELLIRRIKGGGCPNGEIGANPMIALDQSNAHILQFANNQAGSAREYDSSGACVAEFGTFSSASSTNFKVAVDSSCALHDPPLTEQTTPTCASLYPSDGNVYVASDGANNEVQPYDVSAFGPLEYPAVEEEEPEPEDFPLTVKKTGTGTGKVTSEPPGIDCGEDCSSEYEEETEVTLSATADEGSEFIGWSGAGCSGTGTCKVTMSEAREVTATFDLAVTKYKLTVATEGTGQGKITSSPGLIDCGVFCSDEFEEGAVVVLTATADPGSVLYSWKGCDTGGINGRQCTVAMSKAKTVKASFVPTHDLEVSKAPGSGLGKVTSTPGGVLCLFNCEETTVAFKAPAEVTLNQAPAKHFHFVEWLGDCTGSGACKVAMSEDRSVEAKFAEDAKHLLTVSKLGGGQGTVKANLPGINCGATCTEMAALYYQGSEVELTQSAGKGSTFGGWSGACTGTGACKVTITEAKEVKAEFK